MKAKLLSSKKLYRSIEISQPTDYGYHKPILLEYFGNSSGTSLVMLDHQYAAASPDPFAKHQYIYFQMGRSPAILSLEFAKFLGFITKIKDVKLIMAEDVIYTEGNVSSVISEEERIALKAGPKPPEGVEIERQQDSIKVKVGIKGGVLGKVVLSFFLLFPLTFMIVGGVLLIGSLSGGRAPDSLMSLCLSGLSLVFFLFGCVSSYLLLASMINTTRIFISPIQIGISYGPLPFPPQPQKMIFDTQTIRNCELQGVPNYEKTRFHLFLITGGDRIRVLHNVVDLGILTFISQIINAQLPKSSDITK